MLVMRLVLASVFFAVLATMCVPQEVTVRVVDVSNDQPLPNESVVVQFLSPQGSSSSMRLTTDAKGEAHFNIPDSQTEHIDVRVVLKSGRWDCNCWIVTDTKNVQKGILLFTPMKNREAPVPKPYEIVVSARPKRFLERLLWPIMKE
jgi:hypothetical protein